ncbi:hypothetical protein [Streptomyces sp. NPDC056464]|uniref:hypothetical protein n=1 Tax=Streptomyces sp. NPDC056464 TaxID=3345828 RepID=UPI0036BD1634
MRITPLHHVAWSVHSLRQTIGERAFRTPAPRAATKVWPLALLSYGERLLPASARQGVDRGQIDPSAAVIRILERSAGCTTCTGRLRPA